MTYIEVAQEREVEGDLFIWDMGEGLGFRPGTFDGALRYIKPPLFSTLSLAVFLLCSGSAMLTAVSIILFVDCIHSLSLFTRVW